MSNKTFNNKENWFCPDLNINFWLEFFLKRTSRLYSYVPQTLPLNFLQFSICHLINSRMQFGLGVAWEIGTRKRSKKKGALRFEKKKKNKLVDGSLTLLYTVLDASSPYYVCLSKISSVLSVWFECWQKPLFTIY